MKNIFYRLCLPTLFAFGIWAFANYKFQLSCPLSVFLNLEGTILLAFAISFPSGPNRLKWFFDSMNYGGTPSFSYPNFYFGLFFLMLGLVMSSIN